MSRTRILSSLFLLSRFSLCTFSCASIASAVEYSLDSTTIGQFQNGISDGGEDELVIAIDDDVTISSISHAGIESSAPITIRSPKGTTLAIAVDHDMELL